MSNNIIIYHNPRWGKSRNSVGILEEKNINYSIVNYIKNPLTKSEIKNIAKKLGFRPKDFIRQSEKDFKDLNLSNKLEDDDTLYVAMSKFPKLIERPIVVHKNKACIGRPPEKILDII